MISRQKFQQALPAIERYASAILAVVCTLAIRLALDPVLGDRAPYVLFFLMIVVITRLWGRGPGLLATLMGGIAAWYFILAPRFSFAIASPADALNLAGYFAVGAGISFLGGPSDRPSASESAGGKGIKVRVFRQTAVLAGAAVVLTGMVLLLLHDFKRTREAEGWVAHTYRVMNTAESVLSLMKDAESGERGYLLTGEPSYLGPYDQAIAGIPHGLKELKDLTADNPPQQARCVEINRLTAEKLAVLKRAIDVRKTGDLDAAVAVVRSGRGAESMNALSSILNDVMSEENRLLAERKAEAERQAARGRWVLALGSTALILLLVFASVVIERETVRREELTLALLRHANLLEQAHDSLLTWRLGGSIGYWSHGAEILFGYTREEAVGRSPHDFLQTHHPQGIAHIDAQLEREGQWKGELTAIAKDGRKLIVESQLTLAVDSQGNKTVLEANRDITERKRAEAENLLLATAIEQAAETVVITDRDANIQYVNPAFT
ncbi:MAG: CHASE3 domain-containing protein, partial [Terriglobia bacterium]